MYKDFTSLCVSWEGIHLWRDAVVFTILWGILFWNKFYEFLHHHRIGFSESRPKATTSICVKKSSRAASGRGVAAATSGPQCVEYWFDARARSCSHSHNWSRWHWPLRRRRHRRIRCRPCTAKPKMGTDILLLRWEVVRFNVRRILIFY